MVDSSDAEPRIIIEPPARRLPVEIEERLRNALGACPDVAFAHLCQVEVVGESQAPQLSLFVWLVPEAVGSLRAALNLVSEAVARALPDDECLDVLILNSAPELLGQVEKADCLFVEPDGEERRRALDASAAAPEATVTRRRRWFPPW